MEWSCVFVCIKNTETAIVFIVRDFAYMTRKKSKLTEAIYLFWFESAKSSVAFWLLFARFLVWYFPCLELFECLALMIHLTNTLCVFFFAFKVIVRTLNGIKTYFSLRYSNKIAHKPVHTQADHLLWRRLRTKSPWYKQPTRSWLCQSIFLYRTHTLQLTMSTCLH